MLKELNVNSVDELIKKTIPAHIIDSTALEYNGAKLPNEPKTEQEAIAHLKELSEKN